MNHKRKRPKHQRAGCLLCKPQKDERETKQPKPSDKRRMQDDGQKPAQHRGLTSEPENGRPIPPKP